MNHIYHSYALHDDGHSQPLEHGEIADSLQSDQLAWVHLDALHNESRKWLSASLHYLDPFITDALLAEETRPRVTEIGEGLLVILRGVNLNAGEEPEDMISLRLWIDPHRIISVERRPLKAVSDMATRIAAHKGPKNAGEFLCAMITRLLDRMEPTLDALDDATDAVEEQLLESADTDLRQRIIHLRKQAIIFRRYLAPQKEALAHARVSEVQWLDVRHKRHLQEQYDRMLRFIEDLDAIRERAQIVKDELANMLSDRMNKNMYILSVIAAIFLPLGFLTGLFGINVGGMPGVEDTNAFLIVCASLAAVVVLQVWLFKKMKWF